MSSNYQIVLEVEPAKLTPGDYVVMVEAIWNKSAQTNKDYKSYSIALHHTSKIEFKRTDVIHPAIQKIDQFYEEVYITKALKNLKTTAVLEPSKSLKSSFILRDTGEGQEDTFTGIIMFMNRSGQDVTQSF